MLRQRFGIARVFVFEDDVPPWRIAKFAQSLDELPSGRVRGRIVARAEHAEDPPDIADPAENDRPSDGLFPGARSALQRLWRW